LNRRSYIGKGNPRYDFSIIELACPVCGKLAPRYKKFCSRKCLKQWMSETRKGANNPKYNRNKRIFSCAFCGKEGLVGSGRFCSVKCKTDWQKQNMLGENNPFFGKSHSTESIYKNSIAHVGKIGWCKGLTKETDARINNISMQISATQKGNFSDLEYREKHLQKMRLGCAGSPNKAEKKLESILQEAFPSEWKFVGDGYTWIAGKNPDFLNINGHKFIIELLGCYWHGCKLCYPETTKRDDIPARIVHFQKYGFKTLAIWEHELKDERTIIEKIREFANE
jgi:G:T-mismatch repair DNA endonuclease (very short patch repair protein)